MDYNYRLRLITLLAPHVLRHGPDAVCEVVTAMADPDFGLIVANNDRPVGQDTMAMFNQILNRE